MTECYCNVCGLPMQTEKYVQGHNACSKTCKSIILKPHSKVFDKNSRDMLDRLSNRTIKGNAPVALRMYQQSETRQSIHRLDKRILRVRGETHLRLTTKPQQN
jgi:hypothetical protein